MVAPAVSQLPRIGSTVSNSVQAYFGIARRFGPMDSLRVVRTNGVRFIGMRNGLDVDTLAFTAEEIPTLERYLMYYEKLLASKTDAFINDSLMIRILGRVSPKRSFNPRVKPVSVRLFDGTIKTGIPLLASDDNLLLSDSLVFTPQTDLQSKAFTCISTGQIESLTGDVGSTSSNWYRVDGNVSLYRYAVDVTCPQRAYTNGAPPELIVCVKEPKDDLGPGTAFEIVHTRRMGWSFAGFGGFLSTRKEPTATVTTSGDGPSGSRLVFQPMTYSFGLDASIAIEPSFDVGLRATINAQPPTIDDLTLQNSLGMDEFLIQLLGTWQILAIDDVGLRKLGVTTTIGLGPSLLWYRTRTYLDTTNLTSTGNGLALDATWNLQVMYAVSQSIAVGIRGTATYQFGLSSSFDEITWKNNIGLDWSASFSMSEHSAVFLGAQIVASYTFP